MNNEYYGAPSTPTSDFLAHYGVEGMKWGVRKAKDQGNSRALARHYRKASKKLAKLTLNADRQHQKNVIKNAKANQGMSAGLGIGNIGVTAALTSLSKKKAIASGARTYKQFIPIGAGIAAADIVAQGIRRHNASKKLTSQGHADAVKNVKNFRKEMQKAFRGTEYANKINSRANEIVKKNKKRYGGMNNSSFEPTNSKRRRR